MAVSINQLAIYALILVLGWLLGLLSRSGGGAWRRKYEAEHDERLALEKTHVERDAAARARITSLEQGGLERDVTPIAPTASGSVAADPNGQRNDLTRIRGIDHANEVRLNEADIHLYGDLSRVGDDETAGLEGRIGATLGTIAREEWREQATLLASGRLDEHRARFG